MYGTQTKSYYEFGTLEESGGSPYTKISELKSITDEFWDKLYINVNGHIDYDYYVDLVPKSRIGYGSGIHR